MKKELLNDLLKRITYIQDVSNGSKDFLDGYVEGLCCRTYLSKEDKEILQESKSKCFDQIKEAISTFKLNVKAIIDNNE